MPCHIIRGGLLPRPRLASRPDLTSVDTITQRREDWSSASVVNHTIATDPAIRQPGFDPPRHTLSLMNRFRACQGPCRANFHLHKWGLAQSASGDYDQWQTMNHVVNTYSLTKFEGRLNLLHEADMTQSYGWNLQRLQHLQNICVSLSSSHGLQVTLCPQLNWENAFFHTYEGPIFKYQIWLNGSQPCIVVSSGRNWSYKI